MYAILCYTDTPIFKIRFFWDTTPWRLTFRRCFLPPSLGSNSIDIRCPDATASCPHPMPKRHSFLSTSGAQTPLLPVHIRCPNATAACPHAVPKRHWFLSTNGAQTPLCSVCPVSHCCASLRHTSFFLDVFVWLPTAWHSGIAALIIRSTAKQQYNCSYWQLLLCATYNLCLRASQTLGHHKQQVVSLLCYLCSGRILQSQPHVWLYLA